MSSTLINLFLQDIWLLLCLTFEFLLNDVKIWFLLYYLLLNIIKLKQIKDKLIPRHCYSITIQLH